MPPPHARLSGLRDRLARSSRVFLLGIVVACGVEVLVDWNATFFEIGVLRDRVRERGVSYVSMLARSAALPLAARDTRSLFRLTDGVFEDVDIAYVQLTDAKGQVQFERVVPELDLRFRKDHGSGFSDFYARQLARDVLGILGDPVRLQRRIAESRYRDFAERWSDLLAAAGTRISPPAGTTPGHALALYQQALRTADRRRDPDTTWALGVVEEDGGQAPAGAVLVAFDMARTNAAIRTKYLKGIGMIVFFVALILVQNVASRRDKLRLLDLAARDATARAALKAALPPEITAGGLRVVAVLDQSPVRVDGVLFDALLECTGLWLLLLVPEAVGVDGAAVAMHARAVFRARRTGGGEVDLPAEVEALGLATVDMPIVHRLGVILVHVGGSGDVEALVGPVGELRRLSEGSVTPLSEGVPVPTPAGIQGPVTRKAGRLEPGQTLLTVSGGDAGRCADAVASLLQRASTPTATEAVAAAARLVLPRGAGRDARDLVVATVERR